MPKKSDPPTSSLVGELAPAFALPDQDGRIHKLADYLGRHVVIFFYPKDDTPGFVFTHENRIAA